MSYYVILDANGEVFTYQGREFRTWSATLADKLAEQVHGRVQLRHEP